MESVSSSASRASLGAWFLWLVVALILTGRDFLWQVDYFKHPGVQFYRLFVILAWCSPVLLVIYQSLRRSWFWRYEFAVLAGLPAAAALFYETRAAAVTIWVFLACYTTGAFARKKLRLQTTSCPEEIAINSGIGFGILFCLLIGMGLLGLYRAALFAVLLAAACLIFRRGLLELWDALAGCQRAWASTKEFSSLLGALLVVFAAIFAVCATMVILAPSIAFDVLHAHLPAAQYYASEHALRPVPNLDYSYYPQSVEALMALGLALAGQPASQMLPPVFFALTLLVAFQLARECGADRFSAFAGVLFAAAVPAFHWTGGVAKNDYALVFFILAALDCYLRWRASRTSIGFG